MTIFTPRAGRRLDLEWLCNARDLGGFAGRAGQVVRGGHLFRSDALTHASPADLAAWHALGVHTVIDLRTENESAARPHPFAAEPGMTYYRFPMLARTWTEAGLRPGPDTVGFLVDRYEELLVAGAPAVAATLDVLADPARHPIVMHCAVGKDRTGVMAAVVLGVLGVADDAIVEDYRRSGPAIDDLIRRLEVADPAAARTLTSQPPAYLAAPAHAMQELLDRIRARHGSMVGYVRSLGVPFETVEALHDALLH